MPCPNICGLFSAKRISLKGDELAAYNFLKTLTSSPDISKQLATFNEKELSSENYVIRKIFFIGSVSTALYTYLHDHGALFNFTKGKKFAEANAGLDAFDWERALNIIKVILEKSDPNSVATSSRLYKLVNQFAGYTNADDSNAPRVYKKLQDLLVLDPATLTHIVMAETVEETKKVSSL